MNVILDLDLKKRIVDLVSQEDCVVFMKGTPEQPKCGFSAVVVQILREIGVDFLGVDVLMDSEIRQGVKSFSNWPTIPQIYVRGEFIGGCDILKELHSNGQLTEIFNCADNADG